tara:strand:+ start:44 stop:745 length:702 start_codon:yes stop_codon:yes gene_type:complete
MKKQDAVFIACEHSGTIRDKCLDNGILAFSCDLLEGEGKHLDNHIKGDVFEAYDKLSETYNIKMMIAHPSCTYLTNSGVCHLWSDKKSNGVSRGFDGYTGLRNRQSNGVSRGFDRYTDMIDACNFFNDLRDLPIEFKALENPIPHKYAKAIIGKYDMITQPFHHGHEESKATCFWLDNLPPLFKTKIVKPVNGSAMHKLPPTKDRWKLRSKTYNGISNAIVDQWIKPVMKGLI